MRVTTCSKCYGCKSAVPIGPKLHCLWPCTAMLRLKIAQQRLFKVLLRTLPEKDILAIERAGNYMNHIFTMCPKCNADFDTDCAQDLQSKWLLLPHKETNQGNQMFIVKPVLPDCLLDPGHLPRGACSFLH